MKSRRPKKMPSLRSDAAAERFVATADLTEYDLSGLKLLAAVRIRVILGARRGFVKRRQQATATPAAMSPGPLPDAAAVESRSCLARRRERPEKQARGVPEN